ncbi:hypothetical protein D3C80_1245610 [compost metagenome]
MVQQAFLFIDQAFRIAVVSGGQIEREPQSARYQITGKDNRTTGHIDLGQQLPRRMAIAEVKAPALSQQIAAAFVDQVQTPAALQLTDDLRDE